MSSQRQYLLSGPKWSIYICISKWFYLDFLGMPNNPEQQYLECRTEWKTPNETIIHQFQNHDTVSEVHSLLLLNETGKEFQTSFFTVSLATIGIGMSFASLLNHSELQIASCSMLTYYCFPHSLAMCHIFRLFSSVSLNGSVPSLWIWAQNTPLLSEPVSDIQWPLKSINHKLLLYILKKLAHFCSYVLSCQSKGKWKKGKPSFFCTMSNHKTIS